MTSQLHLKPEDPESAGGMTDDLEDQPQVTNLTQARADSVRADLVRMHQSFAAKIEADEIELHQAAAVKVQGGNVSAHETALGSVIAAHVELQNSGAAAINAEKVDVNGFAGVVIAENAELGNTYAGMVGARQVRGERIESIVLLAGRVEGDVKTVVDTRTAILAGMVGGLLAGTVLLIGRALFRYNRS
jgi:hypothetical protein